MSSSLATALVILGLGAPVQPPFLVRHADPAVQLYDVREGPVPALEFRVGAQLAHSSGYQTEAPGPTPTIEALAYRGQPAPAPESGTLEPSGGVNTASVDRFGRIAFFTQVAGSARNQGVFYTDGVQTRVIAMGCGALGGNSSTGQCGDPTPIGGTFSGMFIGTLFGPTTNDLGDVLFYSEVVGGSSPRGLFLYRADTSDIVKVATVGDISPLGGNLSAIGPGSINNNGWIVFLASTGGDGSQGSDILLWRNGVVTKYVASGDAAPGGEIFEYVGFEFGGWPDGSIIPFGPVPAINNSNQIAFTAWTQSTSGHVVSQNGQHAWLVQEGDPAPGGGFHSLFRQAVSINDNGLVAFQSDLAPTPGGTNNDAAWFVGSPGQFRRALGFSDTLLDGVVVALAWSRNPFRPLDEDGNLSLWATRQLPDQSYREAVIVSAPNGTFEIIANESEAAQTGGTWAYLNRWVNSNDAHQVQFGAEVAGNPNYSEAQFIATRFVDLILQDGFENVAEP